MNPSAQQHPVEARLQNRARSMGAVPLLSPERKQEVQGMMKSQAQRETFQLARRQRAMFLVGLAAAALLLLAVPDFLALRPMNFGAGAAEIALLDAGGRVTDPSGGMRSSGDGEQVTPAQPLYLELYTAEGASFSLRVRSQAGWEPLANIEPLHLAAGEDALIELPVQTPPFSILIVSSERPIPGELLDRHLERFGWEALPERLGCSAVLREIGPAPEGP